MKSRSFFIFLLNLLLIIASFVLIVLLYQSLPPVIPFFYSLPWGDNQLAAKVFLFVLPSISLVFLVFNLFFNRVLKLRINEGMEKYDLFVREGLIFTSFAVSAINLITIVKIVRLFI